MMTVWTMVTISTMLTLPYEHEDHLDYYYNLNQDEHLDHNDHLNHDVVLDHYIVIDSDDHLDHGEHLDNDDHLLILFDSTFMDGGSHIVPVAHIIMLDLLKSRRFPVTYRKTTT